MGGETETVSLSSLLQCRGSEHFVTTSEMAAQKWGILTVSMESKRMIYLGMLLGGTIGGYLPTLWGDSYFSFWSLILNAVGAIIGIYIAFKLTR